jgi:hypothetical protein
LAQSGHPGQPSFFAEKSLFLFFCLLATFEFTISEKHILRMRGWKKCKTDISNFFQLRQRRRN